MEKYGSYSILAASAPLAVEVFNRRKLWGDGTIVAIPGFFGRQLGCDGGFFDSELWDVDDVRLTVNDVGALSIARRYALPRAAQAVGVVSNGQRACRIVDAARIDGHQFQVEVVVASKAGTLSFFSTASE